MRLLTSFIGKNRDFRAWLAAQKKWRTAEIIFLQRCELCGRLSRGPICRKCEPLFMKWKKKIALEMKATTKPTNPSIA
jgi:hypothetical protein